MIAATTRLVFLATLLCTVAHSHAATANAENGKPLPQTLVQAGLLNVGVKCDSPPAAFLDQSGQPAGIDVEFSRYIAKNAFGDSSKVKFTCVTSATRLQMLISGKVDLLIATMAPTDERKKVVDFANSTNWGASGILVSKDITEKTLDDFKGKTLLSTKGAWQVQYLREKYPDIKLVLFDKLNDAVVALLQKRGDGLTQDVKALLPAVDKYPAVRLSDAKFQISWGAPAVRRGDDGFREYMNTLIAKAKSDGTFKTAVERYTSGPLREAVLTGYLEPAPDKSSAENTVLR